MDRTYGERQGPLVEPVGVVIPVAGMSSSVAWWQEMLGVAPVFVDADRWCQFDTPSGRICLAGSDRALHVTAIMLKVAPGAFGNAVTVLEKGGYTVGPLEEGPHERRRAARHPEGGAVIIYETHPK